MPLSPPVGRQHLHTRRVTCQGFYREDGLWDIEGRITDEKTYEHANEWRGPLKPGDYVHDMSIRLTLDHRFTIVDVEAVTDKSPYQLCGGIAPDFKKLIGLRIGGGQVDEEGAPAPQFRGHGHEAAVPAHDAGDGGQAKAGALFGVLGGVERLEQGFGAVAQANAEIFDTDHHTKRRAHQRQRQQPIPRGIGAHRVTTVDDEIDEHLIESYRVVGDAIVGLVGRTLSRLKLDSDAAAL